MLFKNKNQIVNNGQTTVLKKSRNDILDIFSAAIEAVDPYKSISSHFENGKITFDSKKVDISDFDNVYLVGFGKASTGMAKAIYDSIKIKDGAIITNKPYKKLLKENLKIFIASHPIPKQINIQATEEIIKVIKNCSKNDLLIVLISGGGSALLCKPRVVLKDLQITTDLLLRCGADIKEINTVRKHISYVKGGQLIGFSKCRIVTFIISDVIEDPIEFISSGPTSPDSTTYKDAKNVLVKYDIFDKVPSSVVEIIEKGIQGKIDETLKDGNPVFKNIDNIIIANNKLACIAAEKKANELGYNTKFLSSALKGEARKNGLFLIEKMEYFYENEKKMMLISGGETTVKIKGNGKGGRNQEMILASIKELAEKNIIFSSFATDGIDGICDAAGAIADFYTLNKAEEKDLNFKAFLKNNNSYEFFKKLGDLLITGPTGTNVMDLQILIKIK